jgi:hypothetical protein
MSRNDPVSVAEVESWSTYFSYFIPEHEKADEPMSVSERKRQID